MSLRHVFQQSDAIETLENRAEILSRYNRLRKLGRNLNRELVKRLSADILNEGGEKLGILQNGTLVFESEDETSVLMDYCIYDVRRDGRNAVEQYLIESPYDFDSDEMTHLQSMQRAVYSIFVAESVDPGFGVSITDLVSEKTYFVVDVGFSETAVPGFILASRLLSIDGLMMTTGAALPVGMMPKTEHQNPISQLTRILDIDEHHRFDPAPLIRLLLMNGNSSHVQYADTSEGSLDRPQRIASGLPTRIGRNEPCPCGSGKKYKKCCMKYSNAL